MSDCILYRCADRVEEPSAEQSQTRVEICSR